MVVAACCLGAGWLAASLCAERVRGRAAKEGGVALLAPAFLQAVSDSDAAVAEPRRSSKRASAAAEPSHEKLLAALADAEHRR